MMTLLAIAAVVLFGINFPRASNAAAWLMTLFFIAPLFLLGFGSAASVGSALLGWGLSPATCYLGVGGAAALGISYFILKD